VQLEEDYREWIVRAQDEAAGLKERHQAFAEVVRRFHGMAYAYAHAYLGDRREAEDAAQEAFVTVWLQLSKLRDAATFPAWLRRIVVTQCCRLTRRKQLASVSLDHALHIVSDEFEPARLSEQRTFRDDVHAAIAALGENERIAITMFYIGGYTYQDISEFLDVPLSTVKKRLYTARGRLRERMAEMIDETFAQDRTQAADTVLSVIQFFQALKAGDAVEAARLLDERPDLLTATMTDGYGIARQSALAAAIGAEKQSMAALLIQRGALVGESDVHSAAMRGFRDIAHVLVNAGGVDDTYGAAHPGSHEFFRAIHCGDTIGIKDQLEAQPGLAAARDRHGRTALLIAAANGYADIVELLLSHGAAVDAVDLKNQNALKHAAANANWCNQGHTEVIELLAAHGHDYDLFTVAGAGVLSLVTKLVETQPQSVNEENERGETPLECALIGFSKGVSNVIEYLMTKNPIMNIWLAAQFCDVERVRQLLAKNPELADAPRGEDRSKRPLHYAAQNWRPQEQAAAVVHLLAQHGADVNAVESSSGWTPLHTCAEWWNDTQIAEALLAHGAEINARSAQGWTPLRYATALGREEMSAFLRKRGGEE
jgi:RNA polymerase sigma factor (sigma-70 family)